MNIEIKHRSTGVVIFTANIPDDTPSGLQTRVVLEKATAARANLSWANLSWANLSGADLSWANLSWANLSWADLSWADLSGADLSGANLSWADLSWANLLRANLSGADLSGADLSWANLSGADLSGAKNLPAKPATNAEAIINLDKVREIILDNACRLEMGHWHDGDEWKNRTCVEETLCGTTHCLAGWLQVCSTDTKLRELEPSIAGILAAPIASNMFYRSNVEVLEWLRNREYAKEVSA
jgi:Pentapeptide repeats (8 copies)